MNTNKLTNKGFTIIEVVLVLAIAGLIFLMVFVALPALQRGQRDTARKNDVSTIASQVTTYISNNRGSFPTGTQLQSYVEDDVSTNTTDINVVSYNNTISVSEGQVRVVQKATCGSTGAASNGVASQSLSSGTSNQFVVITYIEAGGSGSSFCQDS